GHRAPRLAPPGPRRFVPLGPARDRQRAPRPRSRGCARRQDLRSRRPPFESECVDRRRCLHGRRRRYRSWSWKFALNSDGEMPIQNATHRVIKGATVSYMVLYTGLDGSAAFGRCEILNDAVAEVERLRNEQSIDGARIYRLEEVKFE